MSNIGFSNNYNQDAMLGVFLRAGFKGGRQREITSGPLDLADMGTQGASADPQVTGHFCYSNETATAAAHSAPTGCRAPPIRGVIPVLCLGYTIRHQQ